MFSFFDGVRRVGGDEEAIGAGPTTHCTHPAPRAPCLVEKIHLAVALAKPYFVRCLQRRPLAMSLAPRSGISLRLLRYLLFKTRLGLGRSEVELLFEGIDAGHDHFEFVAGHAHSSQSVRRRRLDLYPC
jgi:hypothetical protein